MRSLFFPAPLKGLDPGFWAAISACLIWGTLPLYWNFLRDVSPYLILCHRILWSFVFILPLAIVSGRMGEVIKALRNAKLLGALLCSSLILGANWLLFIWAVNNGMVLETSLGYFITPLIVVGFGVALFRDGLSRPRLIAILIAAAGIAYEIAVGGVVPWVSLILAVLFGSYGLMRKIEPVGALAGLMVETLLLTPLALAFILWTWSQAGSAAWGADLRQTLILMGTGVVTSIPLILYAYGARHIRFSTLGILQYISPICTFLIGLFVFRESVSFARWIAFAAIWTALAIYTLDSLRNRPPSPKETAPKPVRNRED